MGFYVCFLCLYYMIKNIYIFAVFIIRFFFIYVCIFALFYGSFSIQRNTINFLPHFLKGISLPLWHSLIPTYLKSNTVFFFFCFSLFFDIFIIYTNFSVLVSSSSFFFLVSTLSPPPPLFSNLVLHSWSLFCNSSSLSATYGFQGWSFSNVFSYQDIQ